MAETPFTLIFVFILFHFPRSPKPQGLTHRTLAQELTMATFHPPSFAENWWGFKE